MISRFTKGAKVFLSSTKNIRFTATPYAKKVDQLSLPGFKHPRLNYDISLTIPPNYLKNTAKRVGSHFSRQKVAYGTIGAGFVSSYVASRLAQPRQRRRRRRR